MIRRALILTLLLFWSAAARGDQAVEHPFVGITFITRTERSPRPVTMHLVKVDLTAPGIGFKLTPPSGTLETVRQTTLDFLNKEHAQVAINAHFFLPFPSADLNANLIGLAASNGNVYSSFETPVQSYAILANAPAINIDSHNHVTVVHASTAEKATLWNTVSGSAQIITEGVKSIPKYAPGQLTPGGPGNYSNSNSWYDLPRARSAIGITQDGKTLLLFTVDQAGGSRGMAVGEVADLLIRDYNVYNALNIDGGGSTTLAMDGKIVNMSSDNPKGRAVGSNLAVFADRRASLLNGRVVQITNHHFLESLIAPAHFLARVGIELVVR